MSKRTAGEWYRSGPKVGEIGGHEVRARGEGPGFSELVCQCSHHPGNQGEAEANATLLAEAERLLDALRDLANAAKYNPEELHKNHWLVGRAFEVIASAEGQPAESRELEDNQLKPTL